MLLEINFYYFFLEMSTKPTILRELNILAVVN